MTEQRTRQNMYYLERARGPLTLHENGTVGAVAEKEMELDVALTSREGGRRRHALRTVSQLAEVAIYASLVDYLTYERDRSRRHTPAEDWAIEDMPPEVIVAYNEWCEEATLPDIDAIREAATHQIATPEQCQTDSIACKDCVGSKYACRTCRYARQLYKYPVVRYRDGEEVYDVALDIAEVIRLNPAALSIDTELSFDISGHMSAKRILVVQVDELAMEYVSNNAGERTLHIEKGEEAMGGIKFAIDHWAEDKKVEAMNMRRSQARLGRTVLDESKIAYRPAEYLDQLQYITANLYHERKEDTDYDTMLRELHHQVGKRGLGLAYEYAYAGMGDSDARFMLTKRVGEALAMTAITYAIDAQTGLEQALQYFEKQD